MKFKIGTSYAIVDIDQMNENELVLEEVYVNPQDRGQGIGKKLVSMAIEYATKEGKNLGLYAEPQDDEGSNGLSTDALIEFYKNLGFESDADSNQLMTYFVAR